MPTTRAPYGTWPSPLDAHMVAAHDGRPEYLRAVGDEVWWTAPRPDEGGRRALMRLRADGTGRPESVLPAPWNVRNRVIEYGGTPFAAAPRPRAARWSSSPTRATSGCTASHPDEPGAGPQPLTPVSDVGGGLRWCDMTVLPEHGEVLCVLEEFTGPAPTDVRRVPVAVPLDGSAAADRGGGARTVRRRAPLRHRPAPLARRPARRLAGLGPPLHAVGRHPGDDRRPRRRRRLHRRARRRRRAGGVRRPSRVGRRRLPAGRHRPHGLVEPAPPRPGRCRRAGQPVPARGGVRRRDVADRPGLVRAARRRPGRDGARPRRPAARPPRPGDRGNQRCPRAVDRVVLHARRRRHPGRRRRRRPADRPRGRRTRHRHRPHPRPGRRTPRPRRSRRTIRSPNSACSPGPAAARSTPTCSPRTTPSTRAPKASGPRT